jgi:hypothetical protein
MHMLRFNAISVAIVVLVVRGLSAAPVPSEIPAKTLVAELGDPDAKVRDASAVALKDRADALPWLRRATRATDQDTGRRASELLAPHEKRRQEAVPKAIDTCIRDGRIDVLTEWHQYWKPKAEKDLWEVGPLATKAGLDLYVKSCPKDAWRQFEERLALMPKIKTITHDGPCPERFLPARCAWQIRTDRLDGQAHTSEIIRFASVGGPALLARTTGGRFLVLGPVKAEGIGEAFVAADGGISSPGTDGCQTSWGVIVCRGNFVGGTVVKSVILVDGDVDLTGMENDIEDSLIRATGTIRLPVGVKPVGCTIQAGVKDATAPYKFFELSDVGLSVVDDDKGLLVTSVKADTPFGNGGLAKGDIIRTIDDDSAGRSAVFRKLVRRAMVRQGDCLVTVLRGDKRLDLPVFFPLPK